MNLVDQIQLLLNSTGYNIIIKYQIQNIFPELSDRVDFILIHPDYNICIKDYWTFNNLTNEMAQNYIASSIIFNQSNKYNKKFYFIILKKNISKSFNQNYNINHYKLNSCEYLYVIEKNSIDKLLKHIYHQFIAK